MHQLENGYTRIANTILEGMANKKMPGTCFRIMLWVFRNSYGYSRKWTAIKSGRQIGKEINMSSASTLLAIQVLLESGLLVRSAEGEYTLDKKGLSVQDIGQVRVSKILDKSVQDIGQSVQDIGQSDNIRKKETLKERKTSPAIPTWIKEDVWEGFKDLRKKKKAPLTNRALDIIIRKLVEFKDQGVDPNAILDQSIEKGWTTVYALKPDFNNSRQLSDAEKEGIENRKHNPALYGAKNAK